VVGDPLGVHLAGVVERLAIDVVAVLAHARVYRDVRRFAELEFTDDVVQLLGVQDPRRVVDRKRCQRRMIVRGAPRGSCDDKKRDTRAGDQFRDEHENPLRREFHAIGSEGLTGIEPALSAWEAEVLPLNYSPVIVLPRDSAVERGDPSVAVACAMTKLTGHSPP